MMRGALVALLEIDGDISVVGQAHDGHEALTIAERETPDVVLSDIEMPGLSGLELAAELQRRGHPARVVILTTFARPGYLRRALDAGAAGYLLKDSPSAQLAEACTPGARRRPRRGPAARGRGLDRARPAD